MKITALRGGRPEPAILATIGPGGFFGELALLDGAPRSATAVALGRSRRSSSAATAFDRLVDERPALRRALLVSARGARSAGSPPRSRTSTSSTCRAGSPATCCARDDRRARTTGRRRPDGEFRLPWPYTQGELAGMIGGSRQSVNRLLADFVEQGLLRFDGDVAGHPRSAARLADAARR